MKSTTLKAVALALILSGCNVALRPDPNPYAITSNVPTAEIVACGNRFLGLAACSAVRGEPLSNVKIQVQGYNVGTIRVTSDSCGVDFDVRYAGSVPVDVPIPGVAQENCVLAIAVLPEFPDEKENAVVIGALKAFVRIRVIDKGQDWQWYSNRIAENADETISIDSGDGRLVVRGCDAQLDRPAVAVEGKITFKLSELPNKGVKGCVYEGAVIGDSSSKLFTVMIWRHTKDYVKAVSPGFTLGADSLALFGENATTVLSFDNTYVVAQSASSKFDPKVKHVVRSLTVGGRNTIGEYDPEKGFTWKR